jgi:hypothetical protein
MNLERPIAPDPYELLPKVPSFTLESTDIKSKAPIEEDYAYAGAVHRPARRAMPSPASIPTLRHLRDSGTGSSWTCRDPSRHSLPVPAAKVGRVCPRAPSTAGTTTAAPTTAVRRHRRATARTATTSPCTRSMLSGSAWTPPAHPPPCRSPCSGIFWREDCSWGPTSSAEPSVQGRKVQPFFEDGAGFDSSPREGCERRRTNQPRTAAPARSSFARRLRSPCGP